MQVLTPSGYKDPATLADGAEVCAFDPVSGAAIVNHVENIDFVDYAEWCRWWQIEEAVPAFNWYRINGTYLVFREQSIWRNGANVCHARDLVVGDEIYDDADHPVAITSIETVEDNSLVWYRFDISGDHSYIVDGLTVHNASRFWVLGTGTWDSSTTTNWSATTGGAGGASVPGSADSVTLNGSSGGGTVTLNFGGTITIQDISTGAFTGTFDNSVNSNDMTLSSSTGFDSNSTGTRTVKLGAATYTLTNSSTKWSFAATNLTYTGSSASVVFSGGNGSPTLNLANLSSHPNMTFGALTASAGNRYIVNGGGTIASLSVTAPNVVTFPTAAATMVTNGFTLSGTSSDQICIQSTTFAARATLTLTGSTTVQYAGIRDISFTNAFTASNCFSLGNVANATISAPTGGIGGYVIGG